MDIGISPYGSDRSAALRLCDAAAEAGIDRFWMGDGMFHRPDFALWRGGLEAMTTLAWINGRHPTASIGVTAAVLPLRDMEWLIREACTLDNLSEGRFILVVAAGFWADELAHRGVDPSQRGAAFRSQLARFQESLASGLLSPHPVNESGLPIWLAGGEATMQHALSFGLPFQASRALPADLAPLAERFFDQGGKTLAHRICVEAGHAAPDGVDVQRHVLSGSAQQITEGLASFAEMGVSDCSLVLGHDDASGLATFEVLATEVLPALGE